jgi:hypothetical protein
MLLLSYVVRYCPSQETKVFGRNPEERFKRLARSLQAMDERDRARVDKEKKLEELRQNAVKELHSICAGFVGHVNGFSSTVKLELSPPDFIIDGFGEAKVHLLQIGVNGRVIQFSFRGTSEMEATDDLRVPYTIEGSVRWFNNEMLERDEVKDHPLYYCLERGNWAWRYQDLNTHRLGLIDDDFLADRFEELIGR